MSGLATVLAGRATPGIYRWHGAFEPPEVRHTVEHAGWRFAHVDGWHGDTKQEFLASVGEALSFPDYYGQSFGAVTDQPGGDAEEFVAQAGAVGRPRPSIPVSAWRRTERFRRLARPTSRPC